MKDSFVAYSSVTVFYDPVAIKKTRHAAATAYEWVKEKLQAAISQSTIVHAQEKEPVSMPVCYDEDLGTDLQTLAAGKQLSTKDIIDIHTSRTYKVYMLGFLPGFCYMGEIDERLAAPRKPQPVPVTGGSVGVVNFQTGIYPLNSPGGWHIIGQTPLKLFDPAREDPVLLHAGDEVKFYPVTREVYEEMLKGK